MVRDSVCGELGVRWLLIVEPVLGVLCLYRSAGGVERCSGAS
jgi:hypothetical protein